MVTYPPSPDGIRSTPTKSAPTDEAAATASFLVADDGSTGFSSSELLGTYTESPRNYFMSLELGQ